MKWSASLLLRLAMKPNGGGQGKHPIGDIIINSLEAVLFFLGDTALRRARLLWPLGMLFNDLRQLNRGQVTDLFQPPRKHGAPPASGTYNGLKGLAVFVAERLEASGKKREDAWKKVADELARMRVKPARKGARDIDHIIPRTIKKWHEDISADIAGTSEASDSCAM